METPETIKTPAESTRHQVLEAINTGKVQMVPRWRFALSAGLLGTGAIIVSLTLLFVVSLIVFMLNESGAWLVPGFGPRGWYAFFVSLPWLLIVVSIIFLVLLEILVRRYAFAYRRPLLLSLAGITLFVSMSSFIFARTGLHHQLATFALGPHMPFPGYFYQEFHSGTLRNIHRGQIKTLTNRGFLLGVRQDELISVLVTNNTRLPAGAVFSAGDRVMVFGQPQGYEFEAFGVRKIGR